MHESLRELPLNLKEAIDWLFIVSRSGAIFRLAAYVRGVLVDSNPTEPRQHYISNLNAKVKEALSQWPLAETSEFQKILKLYEPTHNDSKVAKCLGLDDDEEKNVNPMVKYEVTPWQVERYLNNCVKHFKGLLRRIMKPGHYRSSYSKWANWRSDCEYDPQECANLFISVLPLVHASLELLYEYCSHWNYRGQMITDTRENHLGSYFEALGFDPKEDFKEGVDGGDAAESLMFARWDFLERMRMLCGFWVYY
uniref:Uncharacterized protein n=1 Tax=Amblyomma aureolatum TaxID=187763 RepID=A0A1E1XGU1_9ACAR